MARYVEIYREALLNDNRMCLVGMMSAELDDLPTEVRQEVENFFAMNIDWLTRVLTLAQPDADENALADQALAILAAIEGAQLIARGRQDLAAYDRAIAAYRVAGLIP
jgi:TetR/AcrR family transcriptional repressor of nem operon